MVNPREDSFVQKLVSGYKQCYTFGVILRVEFRLFASTQLCHGTKHPPKISKRHFVTELSALCAHHARVQEGVAKSQFFLQASGFQKWRLTPETLWNEFTPSNTPAWQVLDRKEKEVFLGQTAELAGPADKLSTGMVCLIPDSLCFSIAVQDLSHRDKSREWNVSKQKWNLC